MKSINIVRKGEGENYNYSQDHCFIKLSSRETNGEFDVFLEQLSTMSEADFSDHELMKSLSERFDIYEE